MPWKILLAGLLVFVVVGAPHAREVEVTGSATIYSNNVGGARTQALKNAQRQAVEQGIGVVIDSNTLARNYEVIRDEILSTSQGFVSNYEILKEGTVGESVFEVTIRAEVEEGKIKDTLTALRILHKKMGNKRLMIVYHSQDPHALPRDNGAVTTTLGAVREEFNKAGFRMFNDQQMTRIYQAIEQEALVDRAVDNLLVLALDQQAEILVQMEMIAGKRDQRGGGFWAVKTTLRLGIYDAATGRQIADIVTEGKELSSKKPGNYDWYRMLGKAGVRAGAEAGRQGISRIAEFYQNVGDSGFAYLLIFRNFSFDQEDAILDYLEGSPGFQQLSELKNTRNYLELELFSSEEKSRLRRKIRRDLRDLEIEVATQSVSGNRMVFINPDAE